MEEIIISFKVHNDLNNLITTLHQKAYFGFIKTAAIEYYVY